MSPAGFEPAIPKETDLKSVALDHSAKVTMLISLRQLTFVYIVAVRNHKIASRGIEPLTLRLKAECSALLS